MYRTTIHIRFFRLIYNSPERSNVFTGVNVSIFIVSAIIACKRLICSIANMMANGTSFRSICWFNHNQFNTIKSSFIFYKRPQLPKGPPTKFCSKRFISAFRCSPNMGEVFYGNSFILTLCRSYNGLCNKVVLNCCGSSFFASKPFQKFCTASFARPCFTLCAFALNRTMNPFSMFSILIKPFGGMFNSIRSNCNIRNSEIYSYKLLHVFNICVRNINSLKQIKLSFIINQICFALYIGQIFRVVTDKWNFQSTSHRPYRYGIIEVSQYSTVVSNGAKWFKNSLMLFVQLIGIRDLANTPYQELAAEIKCCLKRVINFFVDFELIENLPIPNNFRNGITARICFVDSFQKRACLITGWKKFNFQYQFHVPKIIIVQIIEK